MTTTLKPRIWAVKTALAEAPRIYQRGEVSFDEEAMISGVNIATTMYVTKPMFGASLNQMLSTLAPEEYRYQMACMILDVGQEAAYRMFQKQDVDWMALAVKYGVAEFGEPMLSGTVKY